MTHAARCLTLVLVFAASPRLAGQTPPPAHPPADEVKIYTAQHAAPADLVKALGRLYDNARLRCVAAPSGRAVVLSGRPTDVQQAVQALAALDARPAVVVAVEVLIVTAGDAPLDPKLFRGSGAEVAAALEGLKKDGVTVRRIVVDGVEGQPATKQTGEDRAFVVATNVNAAGASAAAGPKRTTGGTWARRSRSPRGCGRTGGSAWT